MWIPIKQLKIDFYTNYLDILLVDGSELRRCYYQADGDFWWELKNIFIDPEHVISWRKSEKQD